MLIRSVFGVLVVAALMATLALRAGATARAFGIDQSPPGSGGQRYVPTVTAVSSSKTCPDGTVALLAQVCPAPLQVCSSGEVIYASQVCPGTQPPVAATPGSIPQDAGTSPPPGGVAGPTLTMCGSASSFNPASGSGVLDEQTTVAVGQSVLCGDTFTAGPGCQPTGESVDFGDGSQPFVSSQLSGASHSYSQPGTYSVSDTIAGCPSPIAATVTVSPVAAGASPAPQAVVFGTGARTTCAPPAMPSNVTVAAQPDLFHAAIAWSDPTGDATGYQIASGDGSLVGTAGSAVTQFTAANWYDATTGGMIQVAPTGWWDFFSVTAFNACGSSPAAWGQVRMPCPDGSPGESTGDASNSCSRTAAAGPS